MTTGLILFAHGARDARWREPFDRLQALVAQRHPGPVSLAFLELVSPDLAQAAAQLAAAGATQLVVVPLFLGTGGHLRQDLPAMLAAAQAAAGIPMTAVTAVGEEDGVLAAMAEYCIRSGARRT
ncbi:MAG TPA: CbiX/SirB N-terminal domain-containing protein [Burkholderiales bacterium]